MWLVLANDLGAEAKCAMMITTKRMQGPPSPLPYKAWNIDPVDVVGCNVIFNEAAEGNAMVMAEPGSKTSLVSNPVELVYHSGAACVWTIMCERDVLHVI